MYTEWECGGVRQMMRVYRVGCRGEVEDPGVQSGNVVVVE